ncbi:MAG: DsbA family oxidoreductase [Deltaproteobacteria bacterium]|nr:DsbA family oxidoreductase [Deltaproteobacteria bacterium]
MKIEIWSDLICPWCGLGQHRLEQALAGFAHREQVEVVHRSFQLDPGASSTPQTARELLTTKYGMKEPQLAATFARIEGMAASEGLAPYIVGNNVVGNTSLAHQLLAFASERGLEDAAWKHLYRAYFGERRSIFGIDALVELGSELGLDVTELRAALTEGRYQPRVDAEGREAQELGSTGVPFVVIDRRYAVAGAQPVEAFREAIERAWREHPTPIVIASGEVCGPDGCA